MLKGNRLVYLWCMLGGGIILAAIVPDNSLIYKFIADYDSNRWCHFLVYASVLAIPFAGWKHKQSFLFSFIPPIIGIIFELLRSHVAGAAVHAQNVEADLFGIAGGILLGLNLRVMRNSSTPLDSVNTNDSDRSTT